MFAVPRKSRSGQIKTDRLIEELGRVEGHLQHWIKSSENNARMFRQDPIAAMRAAGLDIDDELICELEIIMHRIARKLK
jgi:hypothetical protein